MLFLIQQIYLFWLTIVLLVSKCIKFVSSKILFMVSKKVMLKMLPILLGFEIVSFSMYRCIISQCIIQKATFSIF
jgi:hypothetical protein